MRVWTWIVPTAMLLVLGACGAPTAPKAAPTGTAVPSAGDGVVFPDGSLIADVAVSGMTPDAAARSIRQQYSVQLLPIALTTDQLTVTLQPDQIEWQPAVAEMIREAETQLQANQAVRVPLRVTYNRVALQQEIKDLAASQPESSRVVPLRGSEPFSVSFVVSPTYTVDQTATLALLESHLATAPMSQTAHIVTAPMTATLSMSSTGHLSGTAYLQQELDRMVASWDGVAGVVVMDMQGNVLAQANPDTVFSAASVMKAAIQLFAYSQVERFSEDELAALDAMIINSDNLAANDVLATAIHSQGTEEALRAAYDMSDLLKSLGLKHTYQYLPYEAYDYLVNVVGIDMRTGPEHEGAPPYTAPDLVLRTTPAEMARLFVWIDQCRSGFGPLPERFPDTLTPARCQEMLDRLARNDDNARLVAGLPAGTRVEHKSGWIDDMQADVGIIRTSGGDLVVSVFAWQDVTTLLDEDVHPFLAGVARLAYTALNPVVLSGEGES